MALDIYGVDKYDPSAVSFTPNYDLSKLDVSPLDKLSEHILDINKKNKEDIIKNYNQMKSYQDLTTGLNFSMQRNKEVIDKAKSNLGIDDNIFKLSMSDLKNPFKIGDITSKMNNLMQHPDVKEAILEEERLKELQRNVDKLSRTRGPNDNMTVLAKNDIIELQTNPNGLTDEGYGVFDINPDNYKEYNLDTLIEGYLKDLPKETTMQLGKPLVDGYATLETYQKHKNSLEEVAANFMTLYGNDPRFLNTLRVKYPGVDMKDLPSRVPELANTIKDVVKGLVSKTGYGTSQLVKTELKESPKSTLNNKIAEINARRDADIAVIRARGESKDTPSGGGSPTTAGVGLDALRKEYGIKDDQSVPFQQVIEAGLPLNSEVLQQVKLASESTDGVLSPAQMVILQNKYSKTTTPATTGTVTPRQPLTQNGEIDYNMIVDNEQKGTKSDKNARTGVYSTRTERSGKKSFGSSQLYGSNWDKFSESLIKEFGIKKYKPSDVSSTRDTTKVLQFIDDFVSIYGEDAFKQKEREFVYKNNYEPVIKKANELFDRKLPTEITTFLADMAHQTGAGGASKILEDVTKELQKTGRIDDDKELLKELAVARMKHARKLYDDPKSELYRDKKSLNGVIDRINEKMYKPLNSRLSVGRKPATNPAFEAWEAAKKRNNN